MREDALLELIARIPTTGPDPLRAARTRARCQSVLARDRQRREHRAQAASRVWAPVAGLGCLYAITMIQQTLRLYGIL